MKWNKNVIVEELQKLKKQLGRLPKSEDNKALCWASKRIFGTWNNALFQAFGELNQCRYSDYTNEKLLDIIKQYIIKYKRLPLRADFDGKGLLPYWEIYYMRFNVKKWGNVLSLVDLSNVTYFNDSKHGSGKLIIEDGITYYSHQECLIGRYLKSLNLEFDKEIPYENCNYVFDFYIPKYNVYIEYYGRSGHKEYDETIIKKRAMYNDKIVIEIFRHENTIKRLSQEVQRLQSSQDNILKV